MVDCHYIKRGSKLYGPYYYRSYRVGNKVMKEYLGKDYARNTSAKGKNANAREKRTHNLLLFFLSISLIGIFFTAIYHTGITGKATIALEGAAFLANEPLAGNLKSSA